MLVEFLVHKGILHQSLAVVEDTVDLYSRDVLPEGRKLALLDFRHLTLRIKYIDVDAVDTEKTVGHGRAGIAEVATSTLTSPFSFSRLMKYCSSLAMNRAPTSLKASVGPWNSSRA